MKTIYVDNNATTKVAPEVLSAMLPFLEGRYGNPSSLHNMGVDVAKDLKRARKQVADAIGARPEEIVFTSCGTESDNTAIFGALAANRKKRHFVTSTVEHTAVLRCKQHLEDQGFAVTYVPVDKDGRLDEDQLLKSIRPDTCLVSVMWANNETGVLNPIGEFAKVVKAKFPEVLFHTDAVQAIGKVPMDVAGMPIDLLSLSGHKLHAPKGVGALMIRRGVRIAPRLIGGNQEEGNRSGTENVASIVGLGRACALAVEGLIDMDTRVRKMRDRLEKGILDKVPNSRVNGAKVPRVPNTSNISFKGLEADPILMALDSEGICASSGSACKRGVTEPSHVLAAMGVPKEWALGTVRFSLGHYNEEKDVDVILEKMPGIISKLTNLISRCA